MGWTICTFAQLWAPLRRAWGALRGEPRTRRLHVVGTGGLHMQAGHAHVAWPAANAPTLRPVRVLRVVDAAHPRTTAGRMVISGRMADVCAELDRLAALEAAAA
ncbi:hypothetical protein [Ramlibacter algicola]|uniref:Uncharacterized protein n=1 Tax=Ramlibacter algicola TaxID=2795217 RepID=A0A934US82_9BURK|nr:hypothetical protein [Ramlibacter algicola]MBK0393473.1 hypothetical protein [Ramlibacter algicola]